MNSRILQITLITFLCVFTVALGGLIVLDRMQILSLNSIFSRSSKESENNASNTPAASIIGDKKPFSLSELTPAPSGSSFDGLIQEEGSHIALTSVNGHIIDIQDRSGKKYLTVQKEDGKFVQEVLPLSEDALITLVIFKNGQHTEKEVAESEIKIGDSVIVSYNLNTANKDAWISGVRITRYE